MKNKISAVTQRLWSHQCKMKGSLDYPGSACSPRLFAYSSKSPKHLHACLVSHTQVMHEGTCSLQLMLISPRNRGWTAAFSLTINTRVLLVPLDILILCEIPLSKKHVVPSAGAKQAVRMVLWEPYGHSKNISNRPWVYRVWAVYTRKSGLVIHYYTILITLNNLFPDDPNRDCYFLNYI